MILHRKLFLHFCHKALMKETQNKWWLIAQRLPQLLLVVTLPWEIGNEEQVSSYLWTLSPMMRKIKAPILFSSAPPDHMCLCLTKLCLPEDKADEPIIIKTHSKK